MSDQEYVVSAVAAVVFVLLLVRPIVGLTALVAFYPLYFWVPRLPIPGMNAETILIGFAMALTLMRFGLRIPPPRFSMPVIAFALVIVGAWAISSASMDAERLGYSTWGIFKIVKSLLFTTLMFFIGYWWFAEREDRDRLLEAISFGTGIVALSGVADFFLTLTNAAQQTGRATGLMSNPNGLAETLAAFGLVCLYLIRQDAIPRWRRGVHLGVYSISIVAIVMSLSRGGWLAVMVGHAAWFLFINRKTLALGFVASVFAATIAFPLLPALIQDRVEETTEGRSGFVVVQGLGPMEGSAAFRIVMYRVGLEMLWDSPLWGHGLESIRLLSPQYGAKYGLIRRKSPHSLPLKLAGEAGLIGLGVLFWLSMSVITLSRQLWWERDSDYELGALLFAVGFAIGAGNLFHTGFLLNHTVSAYFWVLYGTCARRYIVGDVEEEEEDDEDLAVAA